MRYAVGTRAGVGWCAAALLLVTAAAPGGQERAVRDMSAAQLAAHLEARARAYVPPPEVARVLPFDPAGWRTNDRYERIGDERARRGGEITITWSSFPPNLRTDGPDSNLVAQRTLQDMIYESLVTLHPTTLEFIPQLATHWWISEDKRVFRFRIDPRARFSDGSEVTADDVYWSFWHRMQEDRGDPYNVILFGNNFEMPTLIDKYTIEVRTKALNWRLFLYFGGSQIFPARYVYVTGEEYLEGYQWRFMPGTGPYIMRSEDLKQPESLTLTRRDDWWAANEMWAAGTANFDRLRFVVVADDDLEFEKFKADELDWCLVRKAQRWAEECDFEAAARGWVKKRRVTTEAPQGFSGFCFNMRRPPFDNRDVRLAWAHLFNREKLMEKLFFNQYEFLSSYYPGRIWANPENKRVAYDPRRAAQLLANAGYKTRNAEGILLGPDGKPFEVTFEFGDQSFERVLTVIREDFEAAGIRIRLRRIDPRTLYRKVSEREFSVTYQSWGAIIFPNPESSWMSALADASHNNNLPGFKNRRVDRLCEQYNVCFDQDQRVEIIRQIDGLIFREHPYALGWYSPMTRILYWDRFGHPERYFSRVGDERDILTLWWADPEKEARLRELRRTGAAMPQGRVDVAPWEDWGPQTLPPDEG